ncbi:flagellar biosynthesis protein FlhF [Methylocucumis oryzae]|uniref:Flagellar biosynthesis protein FlhF n=1 Tax=Methylocucumis oryzae TaxID=1632867 RepID=A0A0F3IQL9_9GAMM|nr:flagellar biosynthesis protein FlhF [Methylocucumis oryzae]
MRMVKEELGPDAVIMSNRTVDGGVEIVAAQDFDAQALQQLTPATPEQPPMPEPEVKKSALTGFDAAKKHLHLLSSHRKPGMPDNKQENKAFAEKVAEKLETLTYAQERLNKAQTTAKSHQAEQFLGYAEKVQLRAKAENSGMLEPTRITKFEPPVVKPQATQVSHKALEPSESFSERLLLDMNKELKELRLALEGKLGTAWTGQHKAPSTKTEVLRRLITMGIAKSLSMKIANRLQDESSAEHAFNKAKEVLAGAIPLAEDSLLETGGIAALIGPTGAGKTTTIAKLAAKFILRHGPRQVALITTDNYRIGAHEQINTYGRILDVPVRIATSPSELRHVIHSFADKRLILIDTAGMSQRDLKLAEQIKLLKQSDIPVKSYLVMSAATEYKALTQIINAFQIFAPEASILTKLDEAVSVGSALSSIIEHHLPLFFVTDGQQVPEDMHKPCVRTLIAKCVAELELETDYTEQVNDNLWMAQGYA